MFPLVFFYLNLQFSIVSFRFLASLSMHLVDVRTYNTKFHRYINGTPILMCGELGKHSNSVHFERGQ